MMNSELATVKATFIMQVRVLLTVNNLYPKQAPRQSAITYTNAISGLTIPNMMVAAVTAGFKCAPLTWMNIYII